MPLKACVLVRSPMMARRDSRRSGTSSSHLLANGGKRRTSRWRRPCERLGMGQAAARVGLMRRWYHREQHWKHLEPMPLKDLAICGNAPPNGLLVAREEDKCLPFPAPLAFYSTQSLAASAASESVGEDNAANSHSVFFGSRGIRPRRKGSVVVRLLAEELSVQRAALIFSGFTVSH